MLLGEQFYVTQKKKSWKSTVEIKVGTGKIWSQIFFFHSWINIISLAFPTTLLWLEQLCKNY